MVMDGLHRSQPVRHRVHDFYDFFLSFGTLLFAFGGASTFPTIQNDMENKNKFSTSVIIAFSSRFMVLISNPLSLIQIAFSYSCVVSTSNRWGLFGIW